MTNVNDGEDARIPPDKTNAASKRLFRAEREPLDHVAVRIPAKAVARIDALAAKHTKPWFKLTRSDMLRKLILQALDAEDKRAAGELPEDEDAV